MELYRIGKVVFTNKNYIVLESRYSGQIIQVTNGEKFLKNKIQKVYIYQHQNEYTKKLYGFDNFKERTLFENLIAISKIGPKTALTLIRTNSINLIKMIVEEQIEELAKSPGVGLKTAKQIIFHLKEKYSSLESKSTHQDLRQSLKLLGFNLHQIDFAINNVKQQVTLEKTIEAAIKLISHAKFNQNVNS